MKWVKLTSLQDLEKTKLTWEHDDSVFARNLNGQASLEYKNRTAESYNRYLEQISMIYGNPEMTTDQKNTGAEKLKEMFESQKNEMKLLYEITGAIEPGSLTDKSDRDDLNEGAQQGGSGGNVGGGGSSGGNNQQQSGGNQSIGGNVGGGSPGGGGRERQYMR